MSGALRAGLIAIGAVLTSSCAGGPVTIASSPPAPERRHDDPPAEYAPRAAGVITFLSVELPEVGQTIGGHYAGVQFTRLLGNLLMADGSRRQWARTSRASGDSVLMQQGFRVRTPELATGDAEPLPGVRFGLAATVTTIDLKTVGYVEPFEIEGSARVDWELLDLASGATVFEGSSRGNVRGADSLDAAMDRVLAVALAHLTEQPAFQRAIMAPRPLFAQDLMVADFARAMPADSDSVRVSRAAQNMNAETGMLGGVVVLHGSRGFTRSAVVISRDGLAIAPADVARQHWIWSRNFEGRTRAARVLRAAGGVALVELSCIEACETVMWERDTSLADKTRVLWVGGQAIMRNAAMGIVYAWKSLRVRRDREGTLAWRTKGRPVPVPGAGVVRADGIVVGIATPAGVVPLDHALSALKVVVIP